jgi:hypothetical protein
MMNNKPEDNTSEYLTLAGDAWVLGGVGVVGWALYRLLPEKFEETSPRG